MFNTLRPRQNGRLFPDENFKCIFLNGNVWILINISLKFVPKGPINNTSALVQIMAWRRAGNKPLSEPMMVKLPTHICVTRPQWVKQWFDDEKQWYNVSLVSPASNYDLKCIFVSCLFAPEGCSCNLKGVIFKFILRSGILSISYEIALSHIYTS